MPRKQVERVARLLWFVDGEPEFEGIGPNRDAANATVEHLRAMKRLEVADAALVTAFVMLAEAVDHDPTNAALWGQYRAAEIALRGTGGADDDLAKLIAAVSAEVGDGVNTGPADTRAGSGKGGGGSR